MTATACPHACRMALLVVILWMTACSEPPTAIAPLADRAVILSFGDSITHGNGAGEHQDYPAVLAALSGHTVINAGVPGEISAAGRARLPDLLDRHQPGLLILCHGGNDMLRKIDPAVTRSNLEAMIDMARSRNIPAMLIGVPRPGLFLLESAALYNELASEHGVLYDGDILPAIYSDNALKSDHIHPNATGYRLLAETIYDTLRRSGAF